MAGKGKKQANRQAPPSSARGMMGHLGLKSSALAPVDSKLTSQYMVLDHMTAHYKNLSKAKSTIDNKTPKAWVISQKARDKVRRHALSDDLKRRNDWLAGSMSSRPPTRDSDQDRDDLIAMMESFSAIDEDYDDIDGRENVSSSVSTRKANRLNEADMNFVNHMVADSAQSPSRYHSVKVMKTNIPSSKSKPYTKPHITHKAAPPTQNRPHKPSSGDVIDKQPHKFTEEKPFTPRTLRSKNEVQSKLTSFKYYTAPKKSAREPPAPTPAPRGTINHGPPRRGSMVSRPDTAYSDSVDLMHETLMSRDHGLTEKPMGIPPLDISLDADNILWMKDHVQRVWLKEQSKKAQLRASVGARSDTGSDVGSARFDPRSEAKGLHSKTLNGTQTMTSRYPSSLTMMKMEHEEEELRYLEFVTEVTNDVLDRGIYTNRVLKQVFDAHIEKRKHDLKPQRMYEMLEDLREDLGIPDDKDDDDMGMRSIRSPPDYLLEGGSTLDGTAQYTQNAGSRAARRKQLNGSTDDFGAKGSLPNLRGGRRRITSGDGRPPLPRPVSRGSRSRPGSSCSNLHDVKEEAEDSSLTFTFSDTPTSSGQANILKIDHDEPEAGQGMDVGENSSNEDMQVQDHQDRMEHRDEYRQHGDQVDAEDEAHDENEHHNGLQNGIALSDSDQSATEDIITMGEAPSTFAKPKPRRVEEGEDHQREEEVYEGDDMTKLYTRQLDDTSDGEDTRLSLGDDGDESRLSASHDDNNETRLSFSHDDHNDTRLSLSQPDQEGSRLSLEGTDNYSDGYHDDDDQDTLRDESVSETARSSPPKPTPRARKSRASVEYTPRSTELTHTSESVTVSELDTEDGDF